MLAYPDEFDPEDLRCWRIGSTTWLALADEQLDTIERVQRPVGLFVAPAIRTEGWQLTPGAVARRDPAGRSMLGGQVDRDLCGGHAPMDRVPALLERINVQTLHAGPKECLDSAGQLASELSAKLGQRVSPGVPRDKRDRWGRLVVVADRLHGQRRHAHVGAAPAGGDLPDPRLQRSGGSAPDA